MNILSNERLEEIAELARKATYKPCAMHMTNLIAACDSEVVEALARELLALRKEREAAVPVACLYHTGQVLTRAECDDDKVFAICCKVETPLYAAPPAQPVAVPDDYFAALVSKARPAAEKAMRKFPQPNYVLLKVAEEAGEVVQAGVHYAEKRMSWEQVEGEIVQLLAMLIRLVTEGDQINGVTPPENTRAAAPQQETNQ